MSTELLLRLGRHNLIVELDERVTKDTLKCAVGTLNILLTATQKNGTAPTTNGTAAPDAASRRRRFKARPGRFTYALPDALVAKIRGEVTQPVARGTFEEVVMQGVSSGAVARKMRVHPTSISTARRKLDQAYGLTKYRKVRDD